MNTILYCRANLLEELEQIRELQLQNSCFQISTEEKTKEGFVTIQHTVSLLEKMNNACKHIIAKDHTKVIGFALVMLPSFKAEIPALQPLFTRIEQLVAREAKYVVMGQICISKDYRKQGVFRALYHFYREQLQGEFDVLITEVATLNQRSLQAHQAIGFKIIATYLEHDLEWNIIQWNWK
ncbi:N-acetyltransferase family protein [Flavobacterium sp. GNP001]